METYQTKYTPELDAYLKSIYKGPTQYPRAVQPTTIILFNDKSYGCFCSFYATPKISTGEFIDRCLAAWSNIIRLSSGVEVKLDKNCLFFKSCILPLADFARIKEGVDDWRGLWPKNRICTKYAYPLFLKYLRTLKNSHLIYVVDDKIFINPYKVDRETRDVFVSDGEFLDTVNKIQFDSIVVGKKIQVEMNGVKIHDEIISFQDVEEISNFIAKQNGRQKKI